MKVIVLGAGIGGTTLALTLQRAGLDFTVLEQAESFGKIGAIRRGRRCGRPLKRLIAFAVVGVLSLAGV